MNRNLAGKNGLPPKALSLLMSLPFGVQSVAKKWRKCRVQL